MQPEIPAEVVQAPESSEKQMLYNHFCRVLDMYMVSFQRANIEQIKKIKSLIQSIKNFSQNIHKSMQAIKKAN